ncbi:MAG: beta-ketoacyl-ACP synthase [Burkholderiales bacterium]|jgi:3-oxoacyl-[acyl-carrier-protein] synthase-1|nr:beta-ketoacyl-ACP synthase [Burkholderiales bacterium]
MRPSPIVLLPPAIACALGDGAERVREALFSGRSPGMRYSDGYSPGRTLMLGHVETPLPLLDGLPISQRSRNNAVLLAAFAQIETSFRELTRDVPAHRIAVILGTSTSGIAESDAAVRFCHKTQQLPDDFHYSQQELGSPARMLAERLGCTGPTYSVSTACTSSAKALISGARLLRAGLADLVIAGGVDTLARFTVAGFASLEAVSEAPCLPFSANRCGINIGEAAALFLMRRQTGEDRNAVTLAGWGETSDGYHISAPDPEGAGATAAILEALTRAGCSVDEVGYVNLHGTATQHNDAMESRVVSRLFPGCPASSTKPLTGHTLGAAGALEAALTWLTLTDSAHRLPPHRWDGVQDLDNPPLLLVAPGTCAASPVRAALSTSFAFGGSNAALLLKRA